MKIIKVCFPSQMGQPILAAQFTDGAPCPDLVKLMGTHVLPTAYYLSDATDGVAIIRTLAASNPGATVQYGGTYHDADKLATCPMTLLR